MKRKKLQLNKTTVSNLHPQDLSAVKGGYRPTEHSCGISIQCPTNNDLCNSGMENCDCTDLCTVICPVYFTEQPDCFPY